MRYLRSCDVFLDQFVLGYFGSAGLEAMACGLPVLGRIEEEQYEAICETGAPPILNCDNATEVCQELMQISDSENRLLKVGEASRTWFVDNHSGQKWVDSYVAALTITAYREFIDFRESPLTEPLSKEEYHYLAEGIAAAPDGDDYGW